MRFHLFGPAHIPVAWERCGCRIAALVWNMAKMLKRHGQEVVLYGSAGTDAPCDKFVEIVGPETLRAECRPGDVASVARESGASQIGLQTPSSRRSTPDAPSPATWNWPQDADRPAWIEHRARGRLELKRRFRPGDIGLISCGVFQRFVADECWAATEFIAGYREVFHWSRVFPSAAWMYYQYGRLRPTGAKGAATQIPAAARLCGLPRPAPNGMGDHVGSPLRRHDGASSRCRGPRPTAWATT